MDNIKLRDYVYQKDDINLVAINDLAKRQTKESRFSYFDGDPFELIKIVEINFHKRIAGYRDGVIRVPVNPNRFYSGIVTLNDGDIIAGKYEARQKGEEPRKATWKMGGEKLPAKYCEIILYRHDVLDKEASTNAQWEIVSINASPSYENVPMSPGTLMANHFQISGGTATLMDNNKFVDELKKSFLFWRNKINAG